MTQRRRTPRTRPPRRLTPHQAEARIALLRKRRVAIRSTPENLDLPLDRHVEVRGEPPCHNLVLVVDGQDVSSLAVVDFRQQVGSGLVRMGGIAGVGTPGDHRFRGYGRRVMESSLRWMRAAGFETTMLYGIPSYYPKFGYAQAFPSVSFSLAARDAGIARAGAWRFVAFRRDEHLRAVLRMYHRNVAGRTGPTRRDPKHWRPFRKGIAYNSQAICKVAIDPQGRPAGYFVYDAGHETATVIEVGFARRGVFPAILAAAGRLAARRRIEKVQLLLPEDDAFVEFCKPMGLHKEVHYRAAGGGHVRMVNIPAALTSLAAELGSRMSGRGQLTVRTNLDDVHLSWSGGRLRVGPPRRGGPQARLPQWALAQMLYGYRRAESLAAEGVVRASADAVGALAEMFPVGPHYHYLVDHF